MNLSKVLLLSFLFVGKPRLKFMATFHFLFQFCVTQKFCSSPNHLQTKKRGLMAAIRNHLVHVCLPDKSVRWEGRTKKNCLPSLRNNIGGPALRNSWNWKEKSQVDYGSTHFFSLLSWFSIASFYNTHSHMLPT